MLNMGKLQNGGGGRTIVHEAESCCQSCEYSCIIADTLAPIQTSQRSAHNGCNKQLPSSSSPCLLPHPDLAHKWQQLRRTKKPSPLPFHNQLSTAPTSQRQLKPEPNLNLGLWRQQSTGASRNRPSQDDDSIDNHTRPLSAATRDRAAQGCRMSSE